jgi:hypothetical protein
MGEKITVDFPDAWRKNVVELDKPTLFSRHDWGTEETEFDHPWYTRPEDALEEISQRCAAGSVNEEQWLAELNGLATNDTAQVIIVACLKHSVTPDELLESIREFNRQVK